MHITGLIMYNAGKGQDFIAVELVNGHIHYVFNLGYASISIKDNCPHNLNDNQWHSVTVGRPSKFKHTLLVDSHLAAINSRSVWVTFQALFHQSNAHFYSFHEQRWQFTPWSWWNTFSGRRAHYNVWQFAATNCFSPRISSKFWLKSPAKEIPSLGGLFFCYQQLLKHSGFVYNKLNKWSNLSKTWM